MKNAYMDFMTAAGLDVVAMIESTLNSELKLMEIRDEIANLRNLPRKLKKRRKKELEVEYALNILQKCIDSPHQTYQTWN